MIDLVQTVAGMLLQEIVKTIIGLVQTVSDRLQPRRQVRVAPGLQPHAFATWKFDAGCVSGRASWRVLVCRQSSIDG